MKIDLINIGMLGWLRKRMFVRLHICVNLRPSAVRSPQINADRRIGMTFERARWNERGCEIQNSSHIYVYLRSNSTSILHQFLHGLFNILGLRQDEVFQLRSIPDECIGRGDAADGCIEVFEEFVRNTGRDLCTVAE